MVITAPVGNLREIIIRVSVCLHREKEVTQRSPANPAASSIPQEHGTSLHFGQINGLTSSKGTRLLETHL